MLCTQVLRTTIIIIVSPHKNGRFVIVNLTGCRHCLGENDNNSNNIILMENTKFLLMSDRHAENVNYIIIYVRCAPQHIIQYILLLLLLILTDRV